MAMVLLWLSARWLVGAVWRYAVGKHHTFSRTLWHLYVWSANNILVGVFCRLRICPPSDSHTFLHGSPGGRNQLQKALGILIEAGRRTFCTDGHRGSHIVKPSTLIFWLRLGFSGGCLRPDIFEWDQSSLALGSAVAPLLVRQYSGDRGIQYSLGRVG